MRTGSPPMPASRRPRREPALLGKLSLRDRHETAQSRLRRQQIVVAVVSSGTHQRCSRWREVGASCRTESRTRQLASSAHCEASFRISSMRWLGDLSWETASSRRVVSSAAARREQPVDFARSVLALLQQRSSQAPASRFRAHFKSLSSRRDAVSSMVVERRPPAARLRISGGRHARRGPSSLRACLRSLQTSRGRRILIVGQREQSRAQRQ